MHNPCVILRLLTSLIHSRLALSCVSALSNNGYSDYAAQKRAPFPGGPLFYSYST